MNVRELVAELSSGRYSPDSEVTVDVPRDVAAPDGCVLHLLVVSVGNFASGETGSPVVIRLGDTAYSEG